MSMGFIIETKDLRKTYNKRHVVDGLALQVPEGAIYGFVGPNGAGKTTTMRMLTTLTRPTSGEAWVNGYAVSKDSRGVRQSIGYMPDQFGVYEDMRVWEYLDFFASCYDIPEAQRKPLVGDLLQLVDLMHRRDDMVDQLSAGLKQRLSLARTLAHDPKILILDEPAAALDPTARIEIRELLVELANMGKTIFFSTHILADVQEICTHIGIIENGKMIAQGSMAEMQAQLQPHSSLVIVTRTAPEREQLKEWLHSIPQVTQVQDLPVTAGRASLKCAFTGDSEAVIALRRKLFTVETFTIIDVIEEKQDIETLFMRVTKGIVS